MRDARMDLAPWVDVLRRVLRGGREMRRTFSDVTIRLGMTDSEFLVAWSCENGPSTGTAQCDLALWLGLSAAQVSGLVERLRQRDVLRRVVTDDRRRQHWQTTAAGSTLVHAAAGQLATTTRSWDLVVSDADRKFLIDVLRRLDDLSPSESCDASLGKEAA